MGRAAGPPARVRRMEGHFPQVFHTRALEQTGPKQTSLSPASEGSAQSRHTSGALHPWVMHGGVSECTHGGSARPHFKAKFLEAISQPHKGRSLGYLPRSPKCQEARTG